MFGIDWRNLCSEVVISNLIIECLWRHHYDPMITLTFEPLSDNLNYDIFQWLPKIDGISSRSSILEWTLKMVYWRENEKLTLQKFLPSHKIQQ